MSAQVPPYLVSTFDMVSRAYPDGAPQSEYFPLLSVLSEHLSQRNLAHLAGVLVPDRVATLNDVYRAVSKEWDVAPVIDRLNRAGFAEWVAEEEL